MIYKIDRLLNRNLPIFDRSDVIRTRGLYLPKIAL